MRVDLVIRNYIQRLGRADSESRVGAALEEIGALFAMPNLEVSFSNGADKPEPRHNIVYRSPHAPARIRKALVNHPLYAWARDASAPISLSEADEALQSRGVARSPELKRVEGLMVNIDVAPHGTMHAGFYGKNGIGNGLARSLLHLATNLASERRLGKSWPQDNTSVATKREGEVLDLAMNGMTDAKIAKALDLTTRTVRFHLGNMMRKAVVATRAQLIANTARKSGTGKPK